MAKINKKLTNWLGRAKRHATKIRPKALGGSVVGYFSNFEKCQSEVTDNAINGVAVEWSLRMSVYSLVILSQTVSEIYEPLTLWWTLNDDNWRRSSHRAETLLPKKRSGIVSLTQSNRGLTGLDHWKPDIWCWIFIRKYIIQLVTWKFTSKTQI